MTVDASVPRARAGSTIPTHLAEDAAVPLLSGPQRQGDLIVLPTLFDGAPPSGPPAPIPPDGVAVLTGEATTHTHLLVGDGTWGRCQQILELGVVTVHTTAYLLHPEHAALGLAPGRYLIRRQQQVTFTRDEPILQTGPVYD